MKEDAKRSNCTITLSANAGISLYMCGTKILIDALHSSKFGDYSTLSREMLEEMKASEAFKAPDALIFTHCHEDHFSKELAELALKDHPDAAVILPEQHLSRQWTLRDDVERFTIGKLSVLMVRTPHEGEEYRNVPNYACVISPRDIDVKAPTVLVLGDTELGDLRAAEEFDSNIDVAVVDFPWAAVKRGKSVIEDVVKPEHLIIYHLPFEEDDAREYRSMIRRVVGRMHSIPDIRIMDEFLQTEIIEQ